MQWRGGSEHARPGGRPVGARRAVVGRRDGGWQVAAFVFPRADLRVVVAGARAAVLPAARCHRSEQAGDESDEQEPGAVEFHGRFIRGKAPRGRETRRCSASSSHTTRSHRGGRCASALNRRTSGSGARRVDDAGAPKRGRRYDTGNGDPALPGTSTTTRCSARSSTSVTESSVCTTPSTVTRVAARVSPSAARRTAMS